VSACRFEELEAYVFDELGRDRAAAVEAHVTSCARCAREVGCLRAERQVFAGRPSPAAAPLPSFERVLDRSRVSPRVAGGRPRAVGVRAYTALAMCSAMAVLVLAVRTTHYERAVTIAPTQAAPIEEPMMSAPESRSLACYDVDPTVVDESSGVIDKATAGVEDEYGACLVATPVSVAALTCDAPPL
jgi:anti-sigma factor RsiW